MAQINLTLNQEEILELLTNDREGAFKLLLQDSLNSILKAESSSQLGAEKYERSEERIDSRNGSRTRKLNTRIGTLELKIPRHRNVPFRTLVFDNYSRSEAALVASMAEMVVNGVSTRKVAKVMETLCGTSFSKSSVSEVCKELDEQVEKFRKRPLDSFYPFLEVDATYFKVRENSRIISKAFMVALATNDGGKREIIGFSLYDNESKETWRDFLQSLKDRGLSEVKMITSDAHEGILYAISRVFPEAPWQRCQAHFSRNILDKTPKRYKKALGASLLDMYHAEDLETAMKIRDEIIEEYREVAPDAMELLEKGFESVMTVMALPESYRRFHRTSNHIERLNRELKRRSNVIGVFLSKDSVLRIMGTVLMEQHDIYAVNPKFTYRRSDTEQLTECYPKLRKIAHEQQKLMAA